MEENTTSTQEQSVSQEQQTAKENNPTIIIQNSSKSNGIGTAGFVLALIAVFLLGSRFRVDYLAFRTCPFRYRCY